jgi:hypothetical protein
VPESIGRGLNPLNPILQHLSRYRDGRYIRGQIVELGDHASQLCISFIGLSDVSYIEIGRKLFNGSCQVVRPFNQAADLICSQCPQLVAKRPQLFARPPQLEVQAPKRADDEQ